MIENLLLTYCNYHPDFMGELFSFPEKNVIYEKLEKETNELQFLSTISEYSFGKFFHQLGFALKYEKKYIKKTPDWTITNKTESAIIDVYRLNRSARDYKMKCFEGKLVDEIQSLNFSLKIKILFKKFFEPEQHAISEIIIELENWLKNTNWDVGNYLLVNEVFLFEIIDINNRFDYISCIGNISSIDYKPQKLIQYKHLNNDNEITKKISKYNSIIEEYCLPYFIAVDIDFLSGFEYYEFIEYFRGQGVYFSDYGCEFDGIEGLDKMGREWTELGRFYQNEKLSGLFLRYNNEIRLLLNPLKNQIIYSKKHLLECLQKIENL